MNKLKFTDANDVKWEVDYVENVPEGEYGPYYWIHVEGDIEKYSGIVGETLEDAFSEFISAGYFDAE